MKENVAILGASNKPDRFSYKAFKMLQQHGHKVFPVNPQLDTLEGISVVSSLNSLKDKKIDTVTLYLNPQRLEPYVSQIIDLKPHRVIFNPGTNSTEIKKKLKEAGIETVEACTLVMLDSNQF